MASGRKKQDEKNLKTLRELVTINGNRQCFDCYQRGPTYVNMTIGSFVCTKCSGILRGLTPPHRVKSISMATFSSDDIDFIKAAGNDRCKDIWMGLYEKPAPPELKDEQQLKDHMSEKYEKKTYYLDPSILKNNTSTLPVTKPNSLQIDVQKEPAQPNMFTPDFEADFGSADIFNSPPTNNNKSAVTNYNNNVGQQMSFANFDSNPIYNSGMPMLTTTLTNGFSNSAYPPQANNLSNGLFSTGGPNNVTSELNNSTSYNGQSFSNIQPMMPNHSTQHFQTSFPPNNLVHTFPNDATLSQSSPALDRYAALKDLDLALKGQEVVTEGVFNPPEPAVKPRHKWETNGFSQSAHELIVTPATNPFNVKQSAVPSSWTTQQQVQNANPFSVSQASTINNHSDVMSDMNNATQANANIFFEQQNHLFGNTSQHTIKNGGQNNWATANPFAIPQVASSNPFL